jgi:TRAP-type C4-dicarboxylate transport system permease small subunit
LNALTRLAGLLAALCLAGMVVVLGATLVGRPFGLLVPSSDEITTFLMVGMAFFGIVYAYAEGVHVRVDTLHRRLPPALRRSVEIACHLGAAALCAVVAFQSGRLAWTAWRFGDVSDGLVPIPMWIPMAALPLGFGLLALVLLRDGGRLLAGGSVAFGVSEKDEAVTLAAAAGGGDPA